MKQSKVILIEDDNKKTDDIKNFIDESYNGFILAVKGSYQSGLKELILNSYDLLLLDMSIPTWDKSPSESGGNYQKFGGYMILKEIVRKHKPVKTILISMFDDFGESDTSITLTQIDQALTDEFSSIYFGSVFYSSRETKWKTELKTLIDKALSL